MKKRESVIERKTKETGITLSLNLDGTGDVEVSTGIGFLDHMIRAFAFHAHFDMELRCKGDLEVDDHHSAEDCGLAIGEAIDRALGRSRRIVRFGSAFAPMDEALARAAVDLSGRPHASVEIGLRHKVVGDVNAENLVHFIQSLAVASKATVHVDVLKGENDHHRAEAAFKAMALAFYKALRVDESRGTPSTKGTL